MMFGSWVAAFFEDSAEDTSLDSSVSMNPFEQLESAL